MHVFLTEDWMDAAHEIRERYQAELPEITMSIRINQVITDTPFGDGTVHLYVDTSGGEFRLELGQLDEPDAVVMTDYETARSMMVDQDPMAAMQSFMAGKIKVQGDMMKLMAMQTAIPSNEFSEKVSAEIQAITS